MEALKLDYQIYRHATIEYLSKYLEKHGIPYVKPAGGHAVFLDAKVFLPNIPQSQFPGIALANALYIEGGIRSAELGSVMFGRRGEDGREESSPLELVRLAFPRRVYTQSHFDYLLEVIHEVWQNRLSLPGYQITYQAQYLRHFTCHFEPINQ